MVVQEGEGSWWRINDNLNFNVNDNANLNDNGNDNLNENENSMKYLKAVCQFCSYLFVPQWGRNKKV